MKTISFTWTAPALLAQAKTVTRRLWKPAHAARFDAGNFLLAYDKSPRAGGRPIALLRLTQAPYLEALAQMPDSDYEAEGFAWMALYPERVPRPSLAATQEFERSRQSGGSMWVVRFTFISALLDFGPKDASREADRLARMIEQEERRHRILVEDLT